MNDKPIVNDENEEDQDVIRQTGDEPDPLYKLRQSLLDEDSKEVPPKPADLLRRVSEGFKSRRSQTKSKVEEDLPAPRFGVQTAFQPVFPEPSNKIMKVESTQSEEMQDDFLEKRLGTGPLGQSWRRSPTVVEPEVKEVLFEFEREANEFLNGAQAANDKVQSPFSTKLSRVTAQPWEESDQVPQQVEPIRSSPNQSFLPGSNPVESSPLYYNEERKALPSGIDKKTQPGPFIAYQPKKTFAQRFKRLGQLERILIMVLVIAVLVVTSMIGILYYQSRNIAPRPEQVNVIQPTGTIFTGVPIPANLLLPGGWSFQLRKSTSVNGKWVPAGSEWLEGTEIRRVVGIPWNKQTEAVIQTLVVDDKINLVMNNGDLLTYKVQSVTQVTTEDTSILYDTKPSLVIILIKPDDVNRWVVIAYP